jgi:hypothetical protein
MKLADCNIKLESKHDAASSWVEAAKAFLKSDQRRECARTRRRRGPANARLPPARVLPSSVAAVATRNVPPACVCPARLVCLAHVAGAVSCLQQAVSLYTDMGRLGMAARQLRVGVAGCCWATAFPACLQGKKHDPAACSFPALEQDTSLCLWMPTSTMRLACCRRLQRCWRRRGTGRRPSCFTSRRGTCSPQKTARRRQTSAT